MNTDWPKAHTTRKECAKRSKRRRNKLTTAVNVNTSLRNKRKPPGKPNQDVTEEVKRRNTCHKKGNRKETTWIDVANDLEKSNSYQDLERRVQKITLEPSIQMDKTSFPLGQNTVHDLTKELYPTYLPKGYDPINAYGDGNCLPRTISLIGYGKRYICYEGNTVTRFFFRKDLLFKKVTLHRLRRIPCMCFFLKSIMYIVGCFPTHF